MAAIRAPGGTGVGEYKVDGGVINFNFDVVETR
jgi:hypothetical protein